MDRLQTASRNMHLVLKIADMYLGQGVEHLNLVNEGTRGLVHALDSFEISGGEHFESYAWRCIRQRMECTIMNQVDPE